MRSLLALTLAWMACPTAEASVVVWLNDDVPENRVRAKADGKTGGTRHAAGDDLVFPPAPAGVSDDAKYEVLRKAVADGKARWNDFEVEYDIAMALEQAIAAIDVIRSDRDRDELVQALLFQGAAAQIAFEADEFVNGERAAPFRYIRTGGAGNRAWSEARGLMPDRAPIASDVADGSRLPELKAEFEASKARPAGTLTLLPLEEGDTLFVDGKETDAASGSLTLPPGRHWLHVERKGVITGRQVVLVEEGLTAAQKPFVAPADLAAAKERVLADSTAGLPESVKAGLEKLAAYYGGAVFVAAEQDGRVVVLPYAHGAELLKQRTVTVLGVGEVGAGAMTSQLFQSEDEGKNTVAPAAVGSLGLELGIYNAIVLAGTDLAITPGNNIAYANGDGTDNVLTSMFAQPWAGLGAYLLRPTGRAPTAMVAATYTWLQPAHHSVGGRVSFGFPFAPEGGLWIRMTLGGSAFPSSMWDEGDTKTPMAMLYARGGLAARF